MNLASSIKEADKVIIGAGLYGLYSALFCGRRGERVTVLEYDDAPFTRATHINQARIHMGYHYPRSYATAKKSADYFERFCSEFGFSIHSGFQQIYATSAAFSWTNADQFSKFCETAGIMCEALDPKKYFRDGMVDGVFLTREYTYDAQKLKAHFLGEIEKLPNAKLMYGVRIASVRKLEDRFEIGLFSGEAFLTPFLLNATYASINQIATKLCFDPFRIKYELCEMIICDAKDRLKGIGITVMDGPFFSIMPFGMTGAHSLTSVTFTPHKTSYDPLPTFDCQAGNEGYCSPGQLGNCNTCPARPNTAWVYMSSMARKYLKDEYDFVYKGSMFSMKPILKASELDDSRPTVIRRHSDAPTFISVLSGKINTVYDLDEVLTT